MNSVIICEGKSDKNFLTLFLKALNITISDNNFLILGNKSNFFKTDNEVYTQLLLNIELEKVGKVLFVIDADDIGNDSKYGGYENTKKELIKITSKIDNSKICIICDPKTKTGYLESLILSTIGENHKKCINDFLNCSEFKGKENKKAILHQIYKTAYPQAPYNFKHKNFNNLNQELTELFQ